MYRFRGFVRYTGRGEQHFYPYACQTVLAAPPIIANRRPVRFQNRQRPLRRRLEQFQPRQVISRRFVVRRSFKVCICGGIRFRQVRITTHAEGADAEKRPVTANEIAERRLRPWRSIKRKYFSCEGIQCDKPFARGDKKAIAGAHGPRQTLFALGYAGWAPGQLELEIHANGWLSVGADPDLVFGPGLDDKWARAMAKIGIDLPFIYCLLFGALISPTDPIAVMGILKTAGAPKSLEVKISGESLFNDGVGVVGFIVLLGMSVGGE
ncbi:MAG: YqgE/AlgH family protein, partial [Planctomycetes bacterium]|nr:YqgE/AlgH family protein [Planctomycetota bacterium]